MKQAFIGGLAIVAGLSAACVSGQTPEEVDAQYREAAEIQRQAVREQELIQERYREAEQVQREARVQMEQARREMERAARQVAAQARVSAVPNVQYVENGGNGLAYFSLAGARSRIGTTIINADDGALVTGVTPGLGADEAGMRVGDVIRSIDGVDVTDGDDDPAAQVMEHLREVEPGASVRLVVERAGETFNFDVATAENGPWVSVFGGPDSNEYRVFTESFGPDSNFSQSFERLGDVNERLENLNVRLNTLRPLGFASSPWGDMELVAITEGLGRYFDTAEGLLVVSAPADDTIDIQDGDVILAISGRTPNSPEHAIRILSSFEPGESIEFSLMRDGRRTTVAFTMPESQFGRVVRPRTVPGSADEQVLVLPTPN